MSKKIKIIIVVVGFFILGFILLSVWQYRNASSLEVLEENSIAFDSSKWLTQEKGKYPYRELMLNDILYNDPIRSLDEKEILEQLGKPDRRNDDYLYYKISQQKVILFNLHTKTLVIHLKADGTVDWIKYHQ